MPFLFAGLRLPTNTTVEICGVYPANQTWLNRSVVPVFPAAGRALLLHMDPRLTLTTLCSRSVTPAATSAEMTCEHLAAGIFRLLRSGVLMAVTGWGSQYLPFAARVA